MNKEQAIKVLSQLLTICLQKGIFSDFQTADACRQALGVLSKPDPVKPADIPELDNIPG